MPATRAPEVPATSSTTRRSFAKGLPALLLLVLLPHCQHCEFSRSSEPRAGRLENEPDKLRRARINNDDRLVLRNATERFSITIPFGAALEVGFGVAKGRRSLEAVEFTIALQSGSATEVLLREVVGGGARADMARWHDRELSLAPWAGKKGTLIFDARATSRAAARDYDVVWTVPRIIGNHREEPPPHIILISIDTLRADHLGCYGYERDTTPNIDRMSREGVLFQRAIASSSWTLPSHASMFTGLNPHRHGATKFGFTQIRAEARMLAELLWERQYRAVAFTGGYFIDGNLGFSRGFDRYLTPQSHEPKGASFQQAKDWLLSQHSGDPFFLFIHTYDVHLPYDPAAPFDRLYDPDYSGPFKLAFTWDDYRPKFRDKLKLDARTVEHLAALYDGEIRQMDADVGQLLDVLDKENLSKSTCLIFTSDHGEEFLEHGGILHGHAKLYEELVHVPLIVWCPSRLKGGKVVEEPVGIVDIMPTVLEMAGVPVPGGLDGESLYGRLLGDTPLASRRIVMEVDGSTNLQEGRVSAIRAEPYKFIRSSIDGSEELFDLRSDSSEQHDLRPNEPQLAQQLAAELDKALQGRVDHAPQMPAATPDKATRERLRQLGYVLDE